MNKLIFFVIVFFTCGILFFTCQDSVSPDKTDTDAGLSKIPDIKTCVVPEPECGRMTGGGSVFNDDDFDHQVRVTRGFEIHCDLSEPNNLQVNWPGGNKFHLTELKTAICTDEPGYEPFPPDAPFDTFVGTGIGRLNKQDGATISFRFEDHGEPGKDDVAEIEIKDPDGIVVRYVKGHMHNGNIQAHDDKCE
ncbi:MAG: hypothetical protein P8Y99_03660 [Calditrichaceae bacterium]